MLFGFVVIPNTEEVSEQFAILHKGEFMIRTLLIFIVTVLKSVRV